MFKKNKYPSHLEENLSLKRQAAIFTWELFKVVVISLVIIVPVRYFLIKPFYVKGASMEPNFFDKEYLIIDEISYRFNRPGRGDSVVFKYPLEPKQYFIKRIIAVPGERIVIRDNQIIIYNQTNARGAVLNEPYIPSNIPTRGEVDQTLAEDEYFLLGDNRTASLDSRSFGPVKRSFIVGRTLLRGWPIDQFGLVTNNLEYNL